MNLKEEKIKKINTCNTYIVCIIITKHEDFSYWAII